MLKAIRKAARWTFVSAPGVGVLVISIGLGVGYAATQSGSSQSGGSTQAPSTSVSPPDGPGFLVAPGQNLSASDRQALDKFRSCMSSAVKPPSGGSTPPDPSTLKNQIDAAFQKCKSDLPANLQQQFEQRQKQMEAFHSCLQANGVSPPSPGTKPDPSKLEKAFQACRSKLPRGAAIATCGAGLGGPPPGGPPPGGPNGARYGFRVFGGPPGR